MKILPTDIIGCYVIYNEKNVDDRGFFSRIICCKDLKSSGIDFKLVQTSMANNLKSGTIRGLHYQKPPFGEGKIVSCTSGAAMFVVVDLREDSLSYLNKSIFFLKASEQSTMSIYIPKYCASGYQTIEDNTSFIYMMDHVYVADSSVGVNFMDKKIDVSWLPIPNIVSERDRKLPFIWKE